MNDHTGSNTGAHSDDAAGGGSGHHPSLAHASLSAAAGSHSVGSEDTVMRGGPHDGLRTSVPIGVRSLLSPSEAPGLLDVYERTGEYEGETPVFRYTEQRSAEGIAPEMLHMPPSA